MLESHEYEDLEGQALGQLGDPISELRRAILMLVVVSVGVIGTLNGTRNARSAALNNVKKYVRIDYDAEYPTAKIILPNKEALHRVDHPISGKIMSLSKGPAFVRAEYDATGDKLMKISASSGARSAPRVR